MRYAFLVLALSVPLFAADNDPRLATVKTAYVVPKDDLGDDRPVAANLSDRLTKLTTLTLAEDKAHADVVLYITAHIPGAMGRGWLAPSVRLDAEIDGKALFLGRRSVTKGVYGITDIPAALADEAADILRNAMRKARGKK